jgi:hypothetical protein
MRGSWRLSVYRTGGAALGIDQRTENPRLGTAEDKAEYSLGDRQHVENTVHCARQETRHSRIALTAVHSQDES